MAWGADRERSLEGMLCFGVILWQGISTVQPELEALLVLAGAIIPADYIRTNKPSRQEAESNDDFSDDDAFEKAAMAKTNGRAPKNVRGPAQKDADDDSDFDM